MSARRIPDSPYPGLRPFKKHEWSIFFGREPMVDAVLDLLADQQLVVAHGSSGCGKSSLIRAGILPRLEQEHSLHGVPWRTAAMIPGGAPLWHLAEAIARLVDGVEDDREPHLETTHSVHRLLNLGEHALQEVQEQHGLGKKGNVCLLFDQFEELFRHTWEVGREEAEALIDVLQAFRMTPPKGVHAIITMRSDHLGDCAQFTGFAELVNQTQYLLPRMNKPALMRAIREPAWLFGGEVTTELALRMIDESETEPDALPLIQHCLMYLWRSQQPKPDFSRRSETSAAPNGLNEAPATFTRMDVSDLGPGAEEPPLPPPIFSTEPARHPILTTACYDGLQRVLSEHADEVLAELSREEPQAEHVAEFLFRALTETDALGRGIRNRQKLSRLIAVTGNKPEILGRVIDRFTRKDCGFLTRSGDQDPLIDISHEALIRCWTRLNDPKLDKATGRAKGWLQREQEDARIWRSLLVKAESGEKISAGLIDERQAWIDGLPGKAWAERHEGGWDQVLALIVDSREKRDAAKLSQRRALFGDSLFRSEQARTATRNRLPITAMQLALAGLPTDSASADRPWVAQTAGALIEALGDQYEQRVLNDHQDPVTAVALSRDGRQIVSGSSNGTIRLWEAASGAPLRVLRGHEGDVLDVTLSQDGRRVVSGASDGTIRVWDTESGELANLLRGHDQPVSAVAVSADGKCIVSGSHDKTVRLWAVKGDQQTKVLRGHEQQVTTVALSADGQLVASASSDCAIRIWKIESGACSAVLLGHKAKINVLAFFPSGDRLVSGSSDNTIAIWDTVNGAQTGGLKGHEGDVFAIALSEDGKRLISGSWDNTVRVWNVADGTNSVLKGHEGPISAVAISSNRKRIISGSHDKTVRIWAASGDGHQAFKGHHEPVSSVTFSPDGKRIVSGSRDRTLRIWDAKSGDEISVLEGHNEAVNTLTLSPDGRHIVSASFDRTVRIWHAESGDEISVLDGHDGSVNALAPSPDGNLIVSGSSDQTIRIWRAADGEQLGVLEGHEASIYTLAFFPDGQRIVSGSKDHTLRIWDVVRAEEIGILDSHEGNVKSIALTSDGNYIVSGSSDNTVRIWEADGGALVNVLKGHERGVLALAISPDDARIVSGSLDGTTRIWNAASGKGISFLKCHEGYVSAVAFSPDGERVVSGGSDSTVRITWVGKSEKQLIERARERLPREMTEMEKRRYFILND